MTLAALPVAALAVYANTLSAPFIFDDRTSVTQNIVIQQFPLWGLLSLGSRPLTYFTYGLDHRLSGLEPWGYHLGNIIFHALNGLLVYAWIRTTLSLPRFQGRYGNGHWLAFSVGLLFIVHPLQTEVVAYISSRAEALMAFFALTAMACLALARRWRDIPGWRAAARLGTFVSALGAALSKESGAVVPLLLFLFDMAASGHGPLQVLRAHWLLYGALAAGGLAGMAVLGASLGDPNTAGLAFGQNPYGIAPLPYLYTQFEVILHYLRLSLVPAGQVFDYDWPVAQTLLAANVLLPGMALLALFAAALVAWRRAPLHAYAILWFFITLAPTSSIVPIADIIAERRMYLPIVGVIVPLALLATDARRVLASGRRAARLLPLALPLATALAVGACATLSWQRAWLWRDPVSLWEDSARKSPDNPRVHANLGAQYALRDHLILARTELERAATLVEQGRSRQAIPRHAAFIYTHLASVDLRLGDLGRARLAYQKALASGAEHYPFLRQRLDSVKQALIQPIRPPPD